MLTLVDGTKYLVRESMEELVELVREFRASVVARADDIHCRSTSLAKLRVLPEPRED